MNVANSKVMARSDDVGLRDVVSDETLKDVVKFRYLSVYIATVCSVKAKGNSSGRRRRKGFGSFTGGIEGNVYVCGGKKRGLLWL